MCDFLVDISAYQKEMTTKLKNTMQEVNLLRLENDRKISKQYSGNVQIGDTKRELLKVCHHV